MSRGIDHVDRVVVAVRVQMLRPRGGGDASVTILRKEPCRLRVIVPRVHVQQSARVRDAACERHIVVEGAARCGRVAELVVIVALNPCSRAVYYARYTAADIVAVEEVLVCKRVLSRLLLSFEPLARHDPAAWIEDVLCLQQVFVLRGEQQCAAGVVEVRDHFVFDPRHALIQRVVAEGGSEKRHVPADRVQRDQPVCQVIAVGGRCRLPGYRAHFLRLVPSGIVGIGRALCALLHLRQLVQVVVGIGFLCFTPFLARGAVADQVVPVGRGRAARRCRDQPVAKVVGVLLGLGDRAGICLGGVLREDVPVLVVGQGGFLAHGAGIAVHVRIRQLDRQTEGVIGVLQLGCQGAAAQKRGVVHDPIDLACGKVMVGSDPVTEYSQILKGTHILLQYIRIIHHMVQRPQANHFPIKKHHL